MDGFAALLTNSRVAYQFWNFSRFVNRGGWKREVLDNVATFNTKCFGEMDHGHRMSTSINSLN